jgi:ABC-type sugar transport system ATPase subunit
MAQVILHGLGKTYPGGVEAVRDLSLEVGEGELVVLVGPSGCGKTTTLRLIAGLEMATTGRIFLAGRDVSRLPPHHRDVALVFQRPTVYPHLSVTDNLAFGLNLRRPSWPVRLLARLVPGVEWDGSLPSSKEMAERVGAVADLLGLADVLERRPAELSGGQLQRVALGRALVRRPVVFLLDEPLGNLDPPLRLEMRRELHLLHRRLRATMVLVTHDQEEALALADRVVVLSRGTVAQEGPPEVVYDRPASLFVARFLGWPPLSTLPGELAAQGQRLRFTGAGGTIEIPAGRRPEWQAFVGRPVVLGFRPEAVQVLPEGREGKGDVVLTMEAQRSERLGSACLLTLQRGDWTVSARREGRASVEPGSLVEVGLSLDGAHLFEQATGRALSHGRAPG